MRFIQKRRDVKRNKASKNRHGRMEIQRKRQRVLSARNPVRLESCRRKVRKSRNIRARLLLRWKRKRRRNVHRDRQQVKESGRFHFRDGTFRHADTDSGLLCVRCPSRLRRTSERVHGRRTDFRLRRSEGARPRTSSRSDRLQGRDTVRPAQQERPSRRHRPLLHVRDVGRRSAERAHGGDRGRKRKDKFRQRTWTESAGKPATQATWT